LLPDIYSGEIKIWKFKF